MLATSPEGSAIQPVTTEPQVFLALGISLALGLLVGLQRERVASHVAGIRTFPLITLAGTISGILSDTLGPWIVAATLLGVVVSIAIGNFIQVKRGELESGITTEIAIIVMFTIGVMLAVPDLREVAIALGAAVAVLLHAKEALHRFVRTLGDKDVRAIMQFAVITLIILPILPDRTYTTLEVLNPRHIWLMVVLVVGISLGGYVAYKIFGRTAGAVLGGIIGGAISSTATTVSYARRSREVADLSSMAALVLLLSTCVMYVRVLLEISIVAPAFLPIAAWPIGIMLAATALLSAVMWLPVRRAKADLPEQENPSELKSALLFGALYAGVLAAVAAARMWFDDAGLYVVAAISGLTDMDAITLSTSRLVEEERLDPAAGWRAILIAAIANLVFKGGIVLTLGSRRLFWIMAALFGATALLGAGLLIFW